MKELKDDKKNQELELATQRQRAMSQYQAKQIESLKAELERSGQGRKQNWKRSRQNWKWNGGGLQQMNQFYPFPQGETPASFVTERKRHDDNVNEAAGRLGFHASF